MWDLVPLPTQNLLPFLFLYNVWPVSHPFMAPLLALWLVVLWQLPTSQLHVQRAGQGLVATVLDLCSVARKMGLSVTGPAQGLGNKSATNFLPSSSGERNCRNWLLWSKCIYSKFKIKCSVTIATCLKISLPTLASTSKGICDWKRIESASNEDKTSLLCNM